VSVTATRTRSEIGRSSRNKGNSFEADVAKYLRQWWPGCCRAVRTGLSAAADPGDLANLPGLIASCKNVASAGPAMWAGWWAELDAMLVDDPVALGFIVEKRKGHADPAMAWAHLRLSDLVALRTGQASGERDRTPVRVRLDDLVALLVAAGYARGAA
jgi:hypothetical protein